MRIPWLPWCPAVRGGAYPEIPARASGVYELRDARSKRLLYVGESHSGRLRKTLLRHFQHWGKDYMHQEPRATFDADRVEIRWAIVPGGERAVLAAEWAALASARRSGQRPLNIRQPEPEDDPAPF